MCYRLPAPEAATQPSAEAAIFTAGNHCKRDCAILYRNLKAPSEENNASPGVATLGRNRPKKRCRVEGP